jgi:hypothetical protein
MKVRREVLLAIVLALIGLGWGTAVAGPKDVVSAKINPALLALDPVVGSTPGLVDTTGLVSVVDGRVVIDAVADDDVVALQTALSSLGMQNIAVFGRIVSGQLPISAISELADIASLRFAQPAVSARQVGAVTSQGDLAMRADIARNTLGVTGAGVKVGVLSDSFNCLGSASADIVSGDLPPTGQVIEEAPHCAGLIDEGRAMLQIVHDVAPGASLAFATAEGGQAHFANNIRTLKANGANVIVDDIVYLAEPMFQDGIIAQAVDTVVRQGAAYFSSAGNHARQSYESVFRAGTVFTLGQFPSAPGAPLFFGGTAHNFASSGPPNHFQRITIPSGDTLLISFQWDSPFFSAGGAGSPNDLDVYLFNAAGAVVIRGAAAPNEGGDAVEMLAYTNSGPTVDVNLMLVSFAGPLPGFIKYIRFGSRDITIQEFNTASSTVFGHANAAGAVAVGAAFFADTPAFGVNPPALERFSSREGTRIFFDTAGNRLTAPPPSAGSRRSWRQMGRIPRSLGPLGMTFRAIPTPSRTSLEHRRLHPTRRPWPPCCWRSNRSSRLYRSLRHCRVRPSTWERQALTLTVASG